ncbi:hypothetical protein, partial [Deinococcus fonticola]|uniref:hypothetical protein n=1 Tax=Deinococcus fonticola TaxID=2528713 RepID=UPI001431210F
QVGLIQNLWANGRRNALTPLRCWKSAGRWFYVLSHKVCQAVSNTALQVLTELASRSSSAVEQLRKLVLSHGLEVRGRIELLLTADDDFFQRLLACRTDVATELGGKLLQFISQGSFPSWGLRRNGFRVEDVVLRYIDFVDAKVVSLRDVAEALVAGRSIARDLATFVSEKQRAVWTWRTLNEPNTVYERKLILSRELLRMLSVEPFREWPTEVVDWPLEAFPAPLWPLPEGEIESKLNILQQRVEAYMNEKDF